MGGGYHEFPPTKFLSYTAENFVGEHFCVAF